MAKQKSSGWLDKYDDGGPVQPNYNDASVSMSADFVGMGNDTTGRNYSPAWGGQFAMGGSMPGAVGFTYARTIGPPAPSKGPYGKKTPASAQNGKTIYSGMLPEITVVGSKDPQTEEYYRNIMDRLTKEEGYANGILSNDPVYNNPKDVDMVFNYPNATDNILGRYEGLMDLGKKYGFPKVHPVDKNSLLSKMATTVGGDSRPPANYDASSKTIQADSTKDWVSEMAHHIQMKGNRFNKTIQWMKNDLPALAISEVMLGNRFGQYHVPGTVEHEAHSVIEPKLLEEMKKSKSKYKDNPYRQKKTDEFYKDDFYKGLGAYQNGGEMKYYQEGLDFKPKSISKDGTTIYNPKTKIGFDKISAKDYIAVSPKPVATPNYNMFDKFVLGTDAFVKDALDYKTYLKGADIVAGSAIKGLRNLGVPVPDAAKEFFFNKVRPVSYPTDLISAAREIFRSDKAPPAKDSSGNLRVDEEAWSMAMGRPTQSKYIVPSKYKPSSAKDPNAKYHTFAKGVIDPKVLTDLVSDDKFWNKYKQVNKSGKEYLPSVSLEPYLTDSFKKEYIKTANDEFSQTDPLANFQIYRGVDPKTKKKYAAISDVYDFGLETANALTNPINFYDRFYYKDGGPIKDDRGQWAHPGKVTKIGSNQITMQGVPYPVLGISDTGDVQMMYPNEDYTYDGSSVTEYPMMRKGGQTPKINNETLARNQRIARADAASKEPLSVESLAIISDAIPDRRLFSEEIKSISPGISNWIDNNPVASYIDRNLNPSVVAGKIVSNFGHIPLNIKQGDYEQALLNFVSPLALISGAPATKNLLNPNNNKKLSGPSVASRYEQGGQLTKLDQLTNFTNYNTKQPGGWLDKYQ